MRNLPQFIGAGTSSALVAALVLCLIAFNSPVRAAAATAPVEAFAQENIDKGYELLKNKSLSDAERHAQFHNFMLSVSDMRRIGLFALGQYANGQSKGDTEAYVTAFTDYAILIYEVWLGKYSDRTLKITGAMQRAADDFVVNADAVSTTNRAAPTYKVSFRIRQGVGGKFIVTDMTAEGISLALTMRSDFTAFFQQHGNRISDLIARLKSQTETMSSGGAAVSAGR